MSDTAPDKLNGKKLRELYASIVVVRVVATDSRKQLVLRGQLYITDCKDDGNTLKPYLSERGL